jgi:hypothetical protein
MENQQMQMPAAMPQVMPPQEMGASGADPMAVFEQLRQQVSPQDFSNQMLEGAAEVDPQAVAEFTQALQGLNVPVEVLSALNDLVDAVLADPSNYMSLREELIKEGVPEDFLPEQFDPEFFAALNIAVDQMMATSTGVQAFAQGGIAELKPIAKAIASYGRNGDTMLAHITPGEARLLQRRGGAGTINPYTGLPEFFLKSVFKSIGNTFKNVGKAISSTFKSIGSAVKKFTSSTVGRLVTGIALGFFLGPAAASFLGVGAGTAAGAAISGFVGGAGSTLLAGGSLKDALKTGAISGLSAGAFAGVSGAPLTGASTVTPGEAFSGQVARFSNATGIGAGSNVPSALQAPLPVDGAPPAPLGAQAPVPSPDPLGDFIQSDAAARVAAETPIVPRPPVTPPPYKVPTVGESFAKIGEGVGMGEGPANFSTFKQGVGDLFAPSSPTVSDVTASKGYADLVAKGISPDKAFEITSRTMAPNMLRTYAPAAVAGLGVMGLAGGFTAKPVQPGPVSESNRLSADERMRRDGTERLNYLQNMPGVVYNEQGEPISGQSTPFPAYVSPGYANSSNMPFVSSAQPSGPFQGMSSMYTPPPNSLTNRAGGIYQPYNNQSMYPSLAPPQFPIRYAAQGGIAGLAAGGYPRRTGQISGPGTEKSDSIPAMLSDGEFVMTASAVRGAGKGSRREGAKKMYKLMHQLEKNSERG